MAILEVVLRMRRATPDGHSDELKAFLESEAKSILAEMRQTGQ